MPSPLPDPLSHMYLKLRWSQVGLAHVTMPIAKQACSGDIVGAIGAAFFSCQQMLGCTLKQTCLISGDFLLPSKCEWGG